MMNLSENKWSLYNDHEKEFLSGIFERFPNIKNNFAEYADLSGIARVIRAKQGIAKLKRAGWERRGIRDPESVAEHSLSVTRSAYLIAPDGVDKEKALHMAMIHDLPEAIVTDFTPADRGRITPEEKSRLESLAFRLIVEHIDDAHKRVALFEEFQAQETITAQWVNDVDKLDAVLRALIYEKKYSDKKGIFQEFVDYTQPRLKTDKGKEILIEVVQLQDQIFSNWNKQLSGMQFGK